MPRVMGAMPITVLLMLHCSSGKGIPIDSRVHNRRGLRVYFPLDAAFAVVWAQLRSVSARVVVQKNGKGVPATVTKAQATLVDYDILYPDGNMERWTPAHLLRDLRVSFSVTDTN